eukprot:m.263863 g.263863  ORF g.263863 m.263863 type:complete len:647 (-) comp11053_c2_seq2:1211-3151(-)
MWSSMRQPRPGGSKCTGGPAAPVLCPADAALRAAVLRAAKLPVSTGMFEATGISYKYGPLTKRGSFVKSWKSRKFVLDTYGILRYYAEAPNQTTDYRVSCWKLKGSLDMNTCTHIVSSESLRKHAGVLFPNGVAEDCAFGLIFPDRILSVYASTPGAAASWLLKLHEAAGLVVTKDTATKDESRIAWRSLEKWAKLSIPASNRPRPSIFVEHRFTTGTYVGEMAGTKNHGIGEWTPKSKSDAHYSGHYINGERHGWGVLQLGFYEQRAFFQRGQASGWGRASQGDEWTYTGHYMNDVFQGAGTYTCKYFRFDGTYDNGKPTGPGKVTYLIYDEELGQIAECFEGNYVGGLLEGPIRVSYKQGVFVGTMHDNEPSNDGEFRWSDGVVTPDVFCQEKLHIGKNRAWTSELLKEATYARALAGQPEYTEQNQDFDIFISYRVSTEATVAKRLWEKMQLPKMPRIGKERRTVRAYLDNECLVQGRDFQEGFVQGLMTSDVFVPLLSFCEDQTGSLGQMRRLDCDGDVVDNVLLELELAVELLAAKTVLRRIVPVLAGECEESGFAPFAFDQIKLLPDKVAVATKAKAREFLVAQGLTPSGGFEGRTVQQVVGLITRNQGIKLADFGTAENALDTCARQLLDDVNAVAVSR